MHMQIDIWNNDLNSHTFHIENTGKQYDNNCRNYRIGTTAQSTRWIAIAEVRAAGLAGRGAHRQIERADRNLLVVAAQVGCPGVCKGISISLIIVKRSC